MQAPSQRDALNVLMLGWEFPPYISGGLGTACHGLTRAMSDLGLQITFVLPRPVSAGAPSHVRLVSGPSGGKAGTAAGRGVGMAVHPVDVRLYAYSQPGARPGPVGEARPGWAAACGPGLAEAVGSAGRLSVFAAAPRPAPAMYVGDLLTEVERYVGAVREVACEQAFDVIHAHDWMTFRAGAEAARVSGAPLVVHVHSTEFDRSGDHVNQAVYDLEREGMHAADAVVTVSGRTRQMCVERYGVAAQKVSVVYNAVEPPPEAGPDAAPEGRIETGDKVVLFLGRITMQKGPEYFLAAAKKVLEKMPDVKFVMAGAGDMVHRMVELAAGLGIGHRVLFTGFLSAEEVERAFRMADLYVMPSVSEPFGITPLEALGHDVPVIISKQSGVSEVLSHVLKVDFWDIHELANKMIAVLRYGALRRMLRENGSQEVRRFSWLNAARQCVAVYRRAIAWRAAWGGDSEGHSAVPAPPGAWHGAGA